VKVAAYQAPLTACADAQVISLIRQQVDRCEALGVEILCCPEALLGGLADYVDPPERAAIDTSVGGLDRLLAPLASGRVTVVVGFTERGGGGYLYNAAAVFSRGEVLGIYRKMHIPDDPLFYEKFYFTPGDLGFRAWQTRYGKIGVLICWDQWYPEGARLTALQGAEILFYPTAIAWHPKEKSEYGTNQHSAWETIQRSHAVANGCYVAVVNRIGLEKPAGGDGLEFWGQSFVAGTSGQILAKASADKEEILLVPVDLGKVEVTRTHWPFFRDRRIDAYGDLTRRLID